MALLTLDGVSKHFGGLAAVDNVSMTVNDGEILAIVGPNGAGKSTLLKVVIGLYKPTSGKINFAGEDISVLPAHRVRQLGIGMVQQTPKSFSTMTVQENVLVGAYFGKAGAHQNQRKVAELAGHALESVGLADRRHEPVGNLNLQEQRFLELARAIAGQPRLLALDEVMAGLTDGELEKSIEIVRTIRDQFDVTIVWVEHVMKAVRSLAERAVVLNFGTVLTKGKPNEVLSHPDVIEAYLGTEIVGTGVKEIDYA